MQFQSFEQQLSAPRILDVDFGKIGAPQNILLAFLAADAYQAKVCIQLVLVEIIPFSARPPAGCVVRTGRRGVYCSGP